MIFRKSVQITYQNEALEVKFLKGEVKRSNKEVRGTINPRLNITKKIKKKPTTSSEARGSRNLGQPTTSSEARGLRDLFEPISSSEARGSKNLCEETNSSEARG